jgi:hypothetical protein
MNIEVSAEGQITLSEVYNGIGIKTDSGLFGIAQRDGGIEVMHNGKLVWASVGKIQLGPCEVTDCNTAAWYSTTMSAYVLDPDAPDGKSLKTFQKALCPKHMREFKGAASGPVSMSAKVGP